MIMIETVYRTHYSGAMPASRAVHEKLAGGRIVVTFKNAFTCFRAWIRFIDDRILT